MRRRAVFLMVALGALGGCGFVAGVDFFDLERAAATDEAGTEEAPDAQADASDSAADADADAAAPRPRIYVLGGTANASSLPDAGLSYVAEVNEDGSLGPWAKGPDLPAARLYAPAIRGPGFVAMAGGISAGHGEQANFAIGRVTDGVVGSFFVSSDAFATPRARAGAAQHGSSVFVVGGQDAKQVTLASVQHGTVTASGTGAFAASPSLAAPRARMAVAASANELYVVGGGDAPPFPTDIPMAHFTTDDISAFTSAGTLPSGRVYPQATVIGSGLLVIGGETPRALTDVLRFPIQAGGALGAPIANAPLPTASSRHQLVVLGTHLYVIGGVNELGDVTTNVFVGDVTADGVVTAWRATSSLPAPLEFHTAVAP